MNKFFKVASFILALSLMVSSLAACSGTKGDTSDVSSTTSDVSTVESSQVEANTTLGDGTESDTVGGPIEGVETAEEYVINPEDAYFEFGDKKVNLPCKFTDFIAAGFTVLEEPETPQLKTKSHGSLQVSNGEENVDVMITLYNEADEDRDYKECDVYAIMVDIYDAENPSAIKMGKIDWSDTADSLIEKLGNPTETYEGYGSDMYSWADKEKTKGMDAAFEQETGKMYSCSVVNFTYEIELPLESSAVESGAESNAESGVSSEAASVVSNAAE